MDSKRNNFCRGYVVFRFQIQVTVGEAMEDRRFIGCQGHLYDGRIRESELILPPFRLQGHKKGIRRQMAGVPVKQGGILPQGVDPNAEECIIRSHANPIKAGIKGLGTTDGRQDRQNENESSHRLNSRAISRSIAGPARFSGTNFHVPMTAGFPMTSGSMEPFAIRYSYRMFRISG